MGDESMSGPIALGWESLLFASLLLVINGVLSIVYRLQLEKTLLVAATRTVVQLLLLGMILVPIFEWASPYWVMAMGLVMVLLAARAATGRLGRRYPGILVNASVALFVGAAVTTLFGTIVVVRVDPWWEPRYFIPLLGMILGNALTGITLGMDRCLEGLDAGREKIETMLAMGASQAEASEEVLREALRTAMIPILNTMTVVGLVTIPGMMTGQILGGTEPTLAARYQIVIIFLIAGATGLSAFIAIQMAVRRSFDSCHRLREGWIGTRT
jgi:putative ABC transport system permease protein